MWAMLAAPLIAGNDIRSMSAATKAILTNADVIAVDQDPLGIQGRLVATPGTNLQVWSKTLGGHERARGGAVQPRHRRRASITVRWSEIGIPTGDATVRDLWSPHRPRHVQRHLHRGVRARHGVMMLKIASTP